MKLNHGKILRPKMSRKPETINIPEIILGVRGFMGFTVKKQAIFVRVSTISICYFLTLSTLNFMCCL